MGKLWTTDKPIALCRKCDKKHTKALSLFLSLFLPSLYLSLSLSLSHTHTLTHTHTTDAGAAVDGWSTMVCACVLCVWLCVRVCVCVSVFGLCLCVYGCWYGLCVFDAEREKKYTRILCTAFLFFMMNPSFCACLHALFVFVLSWFFLSTMFLLLFLSHF